MKKLEKFLVCAGIVLVSAAITAKYSLAQDVSHSTADPSCFASDKLRVQIGDRVFSFPRTELEDLKPPVPPKGESYIPQATKDICQNENDEPIILDSLRITPNITPIVCSEECRTWTTHNRLFGAIIRIADFAQYGPSAKKSEDDLTSDCKTKPYFNTCKYHVQYHSVQFGFQYYLDSYPLEKINQTAQLARDYLRRHDITPSSTLNTTKGK